MVEVFIEFNKAAFRHGVSEADIRHAYKTRIYDASMGELPEKYAVIGFDQNWNPLEVMYNPIDNNHINVHAMKARDSFIKRLGL
jgi:hypothetical protein